MSYDKIILKRIYNRTSGYCHICKKKLSFTNYSKTDKKGAWEVEHSNPRAKGGCDHLNNLYAACISCNREKGIYTTQTARSWHNRQKAPLSKDQRTKAKRWNGLISGIIGYIISTAIGMPYWARFLVTAGGAKLGYDSDPDKK